MSEVPTRPRGSFTDVGNSVRSGSKRQRNRNMQQKPRRTIESERPPEKPTEGYFKRLVREFYSKLTPQELFERLLPDERDTKH
jgi:hypothetical protein